MIFHAVRKMHREHLVVFSIFVEISIPACDIKISLLDHPECLWITRPKWLPRIISNIVVCGVYYPGFGSNYAPYQEYLILHITTL